MRVQPIRTHKITAADQSLRAVLDRYIADFEERAVLAITSKIVAVCEGRVRPIADTDRQALIEQEADYFLPPHLSKYHVTLTIKDHHLAASAGIDESNSAGCYTLWPQNPQQTANDVRAYLARRFGRTCVGVVLTDSKTTPLRWGVTGTALAHSGFQALNSYIGTPDVFGRTLTMTKVNVADGLATAAALVMGEGDEQTPMAVLSDLPFAQFQDRDPTDEEIQALHIALDDDLHAPLLRGVAWQPGGGGRS